MRQVFFVLLAVVLLASKAVGQPSLRGSPYSMERQNSIADRENLSRIKDKAEIEKFRVGGLLVPIPNDPNSVVVDSRLEEHRRLCRPWAVKFLKDLGARFQKEFKKPLRVNSCVRDIKTQRELQRTNSNAAATKGPKASVHLTGSAVDITRIGLTKKEQNFIRSRLLINEKKGLIEATEENRQRVWHVMVFKTYMYPSQKKK